MRLNGLFGNGNSKLFLIIRREKKWNKIIIGCCVYEWKGEDMKKMS